MTCRHFEGEFPPYSSITWNDVWRFCGNNFIGRKQYQPIIDRHSDPGLALVELADMLPAYIPANQWLICTKYDMSVAQFESAVSMIAEELNDQTPFEYGEAYWRFCLNNCQKLLEVSFNDLS